MPSTNSYKAKRETIWRNVLSVYDVRDILNSDKSEEQLAGLYKVTTQTIRHIRRHYQPQLNEH